MSEPQEMPGPRSDIYAAIQINVNVLEKGFLISMQTHGAYSGVSVDNRFYAIDSFPPDGLPPERFWGPVLGTISRFLISE